MFFSGMSCFVTEVVTKVSSDFYFRMEIAFWIVGKTNAADCIHGLIQTLTISLLFLNAHKGEKALPRLIALWVLDHFAGLWFQGSSSTGRSDSTFHKRQGSFMGRQLGMVHP